MHDQILSQQLSAFIDGELSEDQVCQLEARLAESPSLSQELSQLRKLSEVIGQASHQPLAEIQMARFHDVVQRYRDRTILRTAQYAAACAAAVLILCGISLWNETRTVDRADMGVLDSIVLAMPESHALTDDDNGIGIDIQFANWMVASLSSRSAND